MDNRRDKARTRIRARTSLKSKLRESRVAESNSLGASSPYTIALLGVKNLSNLLRIAELRKKFLL